MENKYLLAIQAALPNYFSYFKEDNALILSEDKASMPFIYIICDDSYPDELLCSVAVDYPNPILVAEIALTASKVMKTTLSEPFYISPIDGQTYFDQEAYDKWDRDTLDLNDLAPITTSIH